MPTPQDVPPPGSGFALALFQSTGAKSRADAEVEIIYNGVVFDELVNAIDGAQVSINIVLYIWRPGQPSDRVIQAIERRTRAGVACRVMVDPVGSTPAFQREVRPRLLATHCDVREFRPISMEAASTSFSRNHRKIVVIDGRLAFTGGFGFDKTWLGNGLSPEEWRDTAVKVRGPIVEEMQVAFAENWQEAGGPLLPAADFPSIAPAGSVETAFVRSSVGVGPSNADRLLQLAMASSRHRLWITNAYFVPPENILGLLEARQKAGVDVRVLVPGPIDDERSVRSSQRAGYERLLRAGVRIWEYQPSMVHAKTMVIDNQLVLVGSMNLDPLSLNRLEEDSLVVLNGTINSKLAHAFEQDLAHAKEIDLKSPELPGFWAKLTRSMFRWLGSPSR